MTLFVCGPHDHLALVPPWMDIRETLISSLLLVYTQWPHHSEFPNPNQYDNSSPWCPYGQTFKKLSFLSFVCTQWPYHSEFPNLHQYASSSWLFVKNHPNSFLSVFWGCSPPRRCHRNFWNAEGPHQAVNWAFPDLRISFLKQKEENESDIRPFHTFGRSSFRPFWIFSPSMMYRNHSWAVLYSYKKNLWFEFWKINWNKKLIVNCG